MRPNGQVTSAGGLAPFCHVGWGYRTQDEFDARAGEYLADGLAQGQCVVFVGSGTREQLTERLRGIPGGATALAAGCVGVRSIEEFVVLTPDGVVDPEASLARARSAVQLVLDRGFTGLRGIIDATAIVRTEEQRDALARLEHRPDRLMGAAPVSAFCAFDLEILGPAAEELLCLHPFTNTDGGFRFFTGEDGSLVLTGELDLATRTLFEVTSRRLESALGDEPAGDLVIDIGEVDYLEHNALLSLDRLGERGRRSVVLRDAHPSIARIAGLLHLPHTRIEVAS